MDEQLQSAVRTILFAIYPVAVDNLFSNIRGVGGPPVNCLLNFYLRIAKCENCLRLLPLGDSEDSSHHSRRCRGISAYTGAQPHRVRHHPDGLLRYDGSIFPKCVATRGCYDDDARRIVKDAVYALSIFPNLAFHVRHGFFEVVYYMRQKRGVML